MICGPRQNFGLTFSSFQAFRRVSVHEPAVTPCHWSQQRMATFLPLRSATTLLFVAAVYSSISA